MDCQPFCRSCVDCQTIFLKLGAGRKNYCPSVPPLAVTGSDRTLGTDRSDSCRTGIWDRRGLSASLMHDIHDRLLRTVGFKDTPV